MTYREGFGDLNGSGPFYVMLASADGTQEVVNNRTWFDWNIQVGCWDNGWGTFTGNAQYWSVNFGGNVYSGTWTLDFRPAGSSGRRYVIGSGGTWIGHNSDGTRPGFPNYGSIDSDHSSVGDGTATTWMDAPTIPRASTVTWDVAGNVIPGVAKTLNTNRASTSFTHDITYTFGAASGTIGTGVGASVSVNLPLSLLNEMTTSATKVGTFTTKTYSGGTLIGTTTSSFILEAPASVAPNFTTITASEGTAGVAANVGAFVEDISKLTLAITGAVAGGYGATIKSYKIMVDGQTINAVSGTTPLPIASSGTVVVTGTVTDSRDRTVTKTINTTFLPYAPPSLIAVSIDRSTSGGVLQEDGTYFKVSINAAVQSLINSTQRNALGYRISTRLRGTTSWTLKSNITTAGITFNSNVVIGTYLASSAYDVLVEVFDDFSTSAVIIVVPVSTVFMHWDGNEGLGVGKYRERGRMDVNGDIWMQRGVDDFHLVTNRGTTTQRDAVFGVPSTDAQKAALANMRVRWFNTTTNREETYYAVTGTVGLTVQGLLSGFASGWYVTPDQEWAGKSGPASFAGNYRVNWSRGMIGPDSTIDATTDASRILIAMDGIYECQAFLRGGASGNAHYIGLGLNGDRAAFELRSNPTSGPMLGIWTHDHPGASNDFSSSYYYGQLYAGDQITAGPYTSGTDIALSAAASSGALIVKRIS